MKQTLSFLILFLVFCCSCTDKNFPLHPTAKHPGKISIQTGLAAYTYENNSSPLLELKRVNQSHEKAIIYFGKDRVNKAPEEDAVGYDHLFYPPNSLPIGQTLSLEKSEVANIHYLEFLHFVSLDSGQQKAKTYYPTLEEEELENYFNNPNFYFYPVVGVSKEQAEAYCKWKSQILNVKMAQVHNEHNFEKHKEIVNNGGTYQFIGRLPTSEEWLREGRKAFQEVDTVESEFGKKAVKFLKKEKEIVGLANHNEPIKGEKLRLLNSNLFDSKPTYLRWDIPFYVFSYQPSSASFYNLIGNVSEIVEEGYAIGGSFRTPWRELKLEEKYQEIPAKDVGFRCVCEVIKKN